MTDSSIPLARQPDAFSLPVVARLTKLPNRVVLQWPVTVQSLPCQALLLLRNGIAIVCDNQTYLTTELDAFARVTFPDDTHASIRLSLKKVDVEFANAIEAQYFRTAVTDRGTKVPAADQSAAVRSPPTSLPGTRRSWPTSGWMPTPARWTASAPGRGRWRPGAPMARRPCRWPVRSAEPPLNPPSGWGVTTGPRGWTVALNAFALQHRDRLPSDPKTLQYPGKAITH
jgi:hypothetical protein